MFQSHPEYFVYFPYHFFQGFLKIPAPTEVGRFSFVKKKKNIEIFTSINFKMSLVLSLIWYKHNKF